eukprot:SAG11_NODE_25493_length_358_cov_0.768340_2_plen_55_part_01
MIHAPYLGLAISLQNPRVFKVVVIDLIIVVWMLRMVDRLSNVGPQQTLDAMLLCD